MIRPIGSGVEVQFRVIPRASRSTVAGVRDGRVLVRLAAPPVDGAANEALVALLSSLFEIPKRSVRIIAGERSRAKVVVLEGVTADQAARVLG
ncbi:MAG: DUF167 domain-containing protein [Vicinamibacterales bacterium]